MQGAEIYISERLARLAATVAIAVRGLTGAQPDTRRAMRREHDGSLSQGFYALIRFPDGQVTAVEHLVGPVKLAA